MAGMSRRAYGSTVGLLSCSGDKGGLDVQGHSPNQRIFPMAVPFLRLGTALSEVPYPLPESPRVRRRPASLAQHLSALLKAVTEVEETSRARRQERYARLLR